MKIQDYIHFYMGCECKNRYGQIHKLTAENFETLSVWGAPILRPLDSMTKEEFEEFKAITDTDFSKMVVIESASDDECFTRLAHQLNSSAYLLSKHFDLFNLIPSGLALDATKLTTPVK